MAWGKVKEQDFVGKEAHVRAPRGGAGGDPLHAHRRRPHVGGRRQALHARPRAGRDAATATPIVDAQGPPLVRHERGRGAVGRQARPDGVPAARARGRRARELAVEYMRRALPRHASTSSARRRSSTRRTRGSGREGSSSCVKRVPMTGGRIVLTADEQAIETQAPRLHDQPARGVRRRGGGAARRGARRRVGRADARAARGGGAAPRRDGARRRPRDPPRRPDGEEWDPQATAGGDRRGDPRRRVRERAVRPDLLRQRVGRLGRTTRSASGSRTRSGGRW